jgi:Ca2+-binding EF-hand superfamily protein
VKERLKRLEKFLKDKFTMNWDSVRKCFLDLDTDYDGYITAEDIVRYFGSVSENDIPFQDLKKLMLDKEAPGGTLSGKLSYKDFSSWVGNFIHSVQGFYFRHDSIKNPPFERRQMKFMAGSGYF